MKVITFVLLIVITSTMLCGCPNTPKNTDVSTQSQLLTTEEKNINVANDTLETTNQITFEQKDIQNENKIEDFELNDTMVLMASSCTKNLTFEPIATREDAVSAAEAIWCAELGEDLGTITNDHITQVYFDETKMCYLVKSYLITEELARERNALIYTDGTVIGAWVFAGDSPPERQQERQGTVCVNPLKTGDGSVSSSG